MKVTRRKAIVGTILTGGALLAGYGLWPYPQRRKEREALDHGKDAAVLHTWIKIARDNKITIVVPHQDMGQGSFTGLAQMAADELDADWSLISVIESPAHEAFANAKVLKGMLAEVEVPKALGAMLGLGADKFARVMDIMITGGSSAIRGTGLYGMRSAGAAVREMLVASAAKTWGVPASELQTADSVVTHAASGRKAAYGELIDAAGEMKPSSAPRLKSPDQYKFMGKSVPRLDIPEKVNGVARYAIDVQLPGMKYAAIRQSPAFGRTLESVNEASVVKMPGIERVIRLPAIKAVGAIGTMLDSFGAEAAVAVVADNSWRAENAVRALEVTFAPGPDGGISSESMFAGFDAAVAQMEQKELATAGDVEAAFAGAAKIVEARYRAPFQDHAPMEPYSTTVLVRNNRTAEVWTGCQAPLLARTAAADILGFKEADVVVHNHPMGGGFGRRTFTECIQQAAFIAAQMPETPVKLTWSREEFVQHGKYRPAGVSHFKAALNADGNAIAWRNVYNWNDDDAARIFYGIANQHIAHVDAKAPVPTGPWRSVGHSRHGFFTESFVDELAHAAGVDPYIYRQKLLSNAPRFRTALDTAAEKANWTTPLPQGSGRGIAVNKAFNSIAAQVAEVSTGADGKLKVDRVVCVIDCGEAINPDAVVAQIQGGVLYGLSAALYGEITLKDGRVEQSNFHDYRVMTLPEAPKVEVHIINSGAMMGGVGELGVPGVAPAVANAVFAATGHRLRAMPFKLDELDTRAG